MRGEEEKDKYGDRENSRFTVPPWEEALDSRETEAGRHIYREQVNSPILEEIINVKVRSAP